jgi:hypothetical protein
METETETPTEKRNLGLHHSNEVAAFKQSEQRAAVAARITDCVVRAFHAIGASSLTQEIIFWNLYMTKNVGRNEVMDRPAEFIEGLRGIYGEAGTSIFESMLRREIKREFGAFAVFDNKDAEERSTLDLIRLVRMAALESQKDP